MLRKHAMTSLAALIVASFSAGAIAQQQQTEQGTQNIEQQQQEQVQREQREQQRQYTSRERQNYERGEDHSDKSIAEVLQEKDKFSKFREALAHAGMEDQLTAGGEYTIFAPTNEAFERLPDGTWDGWMNNGDPSELREILSYHIVERRVGSKDFDERHTDHATLSGGELRIANSGGNFTVNTSAVTQADIVAENGYIHVIDSVLMDTRQGAGFRNAN